MRLVGDRYEQRRVTLGLVILIFNIFSAVFNYYIWRETGVDANLFASGVSTGVSILMMVVIVVDYRR